MHRSGSLHILYIDLTSSPFPVAGCFLISAPDVCFDAKDDLTYCWCSSNDLCNAAPPRPALFPAPALLLGLLLLALS